MVVVVVVVVVVAAAADPAAAAAAAAAHPRNVARAAGADTSVPFEGLCTSGQS